MKKALALIGILFLTALPVYSQRSTRYDGGITWEQRNAEIQREEIRRETKRQIEENNRRQQYNQRYNNKYNF
jgi:hypothetical protein